MHSDWFVFFVLWRSHRDVVFGSARFVMFFCFVEILGWSCCKPSSSDSANVQVRSLGRRGKIQIHGQCFCSGVQWKVNRFIKYKCKYCLCVCFFACLWIQASQLNKNAFDWGSSSFGIHFGFKLLTFVMGRESSSDFFHKSQSLKPICIFTSLAWRQLLSFYWNSDWLLWSSMRPIRKKRTEEWTHHTKNFLVRRVSSLLWVC